MRLAAALVAVAGLVNPLVPGDHPDPTVLRAGGAVYASATVSAWAPLFPIYRGDDLGSLRQVGAVLRTAPAWAAGRFWAPELVRAPGGRGYLAYFSAAARGGGFCLGVAAAPAPAGPYRDRGRVVCPPGGAIDASPVADGAGRPWVAYRRLGPGGGIALQPLRADGLRVSGPARTLLTADRPWEGGVVEGPTFLHRGGRWYLLFAGGSCCRPPCSYAEGVARATRLTGPYAVAPRPWLTGGPDLKCPGHGTVLREGPDAVLVHHAYRTTDAADTRRLMVATRMAFGADGWPRPAQAALDASPGPPGAGRRSGPPAGWSDGFTGRVLRPGWEWLWNRVPTQRLHGGALSLGCAAPASAPAFVARQAAVDRFAAVVRVAPRGGATALVGVHDKGDGLRGLELRRTAPGLLAARAAGVGRAGRPRHGAWTPVAAGGAVEVRVVVAPGGRVVALQVVPDGGPAVAIAPGPIAAGAPVTRVALGCHGGGRAVFAAARLRPLARP